MVHPSKVWEDFFQKKPFHEETKTFLGKKTMGMLLSIGGLTKVSKVVSCSIFFILTHTWGIDIFEKLTPRNWEMTWRNTFFALT